MRILHTADWHLGKKLGHIARIPEQEKVLDEICNIADAQDVDVIVIAGDLFDTFNPPTDAVDLFYKTLKKLGNNGNRAVVAIAGNHDSPDRIEAPDPLAKECGIILTGYPFTECSTFSLESGMQVLQTAPGFIELQLPKYDYPLRLMLTPYANERRMKTFLGLEDSEQELRDILEDQWKDIADKYCDNQGVNLLSTHLFVLKKGGKLEEEGDDEKSILHIGGAQPIYSNNFPKQVQYVALGHLHRKQLVDNKPCPIVYSSSILSYSFSEAEQDKYVGIVDLEPGKQARYKFVKLTEGKRLVRKRFEKIDTAVKWLAKNPATLVELTIVADEYLTGEDRKRLNEAHHGIITIIPEIKNAGSTAVSDTASIDLSVDIKTLFNQYFEYRMAQKPNKNIKDLFKEVLAESDDE